MLKATVFPTLTKQMELIQVGKPYSNTVSWVSPVNQSSALSSGVVPACLCWEHHHWDQQGAFVLCSTHVAAPAGPDKKISNFPCKLSHPLRLLGADVSKLHVGPFHRVPVFMSMLDRQEKGRWVCLVLSG